MTSIFCHIGTVRVAWFRGRTGQEMRIEDTCKRKLRLAIRVAERFHRRRTKGKGRKHVRLLEIHRRRKSKAGDRFCTYLYKGIATMYIC